MPNVLTLTVENPDEILNTGAYGAGADIRVQSSTAQTGPFNDISGTGSTPLIAIVADTVAYTAYDPNGISSTWYQIRYENVGATRVSDWSTAFQAGSGPATAEGTYARLVRIKPRLGITDVTDDELLQSFCDQANGWLETRLERVIAPLSTTQFLFDGYSAIGGRKLWVPMGIRTISLLEVAPATSAAFQTVTAGTYFLRPTVQDLPNGWPFFQIVLSDLGSSFFYPGYVNIRATGTFGWPAIPDELSALGDKLAIAAWRGRGSSGSANVTVGTEDERVFDSAMSQQDWQLVRKYASTAWAK